jgi:hypothetical protein
MSSLSATTSGLSDLLQGSSSARPVPSVPSRADESFWQGVFDRAETLGLATADAATASSGQGASVSKGPSHSSLGASPDGDRGRVQAGSTATPPSDGASLAMAPLTEVEGARVAPSSPWGSALQAPQAARWQAAQSYGLAPAERIAVPQPAPTTQAPAPVNATLVTLPNGDLKLYLRAAGLSASQAIEAASLADLPWSPGQAPDIAEVVLNGQTIYTRGVDTAPPFILTC